MNWRRQKALYGAMPVPVATMMNTEFGSSGISRILPVGPAQVDRTMMHDDDACASSSEQHGIPQPRSLDRDVSAANS